MDEIIAADFDVHLVHKHKKGSSLFAARRANVWHFVESTTKRSAKKAAVNTQISQRHIPRYLVAEAVASLMDFNERFRDAHNGNLGEPIATTVSDAIGFYSKNPGLYEISLHPTKDGLPKAFCQKLEEDVDVYRKAAGKVKMDGDLYVLPRSKTFKGNPVASPSRRLIEAIAFERETRKKLDPHKFAIYSAFCTWRDFIIDTDAAARMAPELVDNQFEYDAEEARHDGFLELADAVQAKMLRSPIWGRGLHVDRDEAVQVLRDGLNGLPTIQLAQLMLCNGMHSMGLFFPLAHILGLYDWTQYINKITDGYQPDSEAEQALREQTEFIRMLGDLAADV